METDLCEDSGTVDVVGERSRSVLIPMSALVPFEEALQAFSSTVASSGD